jgi:hypothetical protein
MKSYLCRQEQIRISVLRVKLRCAWRNNAPSSELAGLLNEIDAAEKRLVSQA